jgi:hypothetical protein
MLAPITKVNEGESNTPCPSTLEVTYSSVEKLSKALESKRRGKEDLIIHTVCISNYWNE